MMKLSCLVIGILALNVTVSLLSTSAYAVQNDFDNSNLAFIAQNVERSTHSTSRLSLLKYNCETEEYTRSQFIAPISDSVLECYFPAYFPNKSKSGTSTQAIIGDDNGIVVSDTTVEPYSATCYLMAKYDRPDKNGNYYSGVFSGFMIGPVYAYYSDSGYTAIGILTAGSSNSTNGGEYSYAYTTATRFSKNLYGLLMTYRPN